MIPTQQLPQELLFCLHSNNFWENNREMERNTFCRPVGNYSAPVSSGAAFYTPFFAKAKCSIVTPIPSMMCCLSRQTPIPTGPFSYLHKWLNASICLILTAAILFWNCTLISTGALLPLLWGFFIWSSWHRAFCSLGRTRSKTNTPCAVWWQHTGFPLVLALTQQLWKQLLATLTVWWLRYLVYLWGYLPSNLKNLKLSYHF